MLTTLLYGKRAWTIVYFLQPDIFRPSEENPFSNLSFSVPVSLPLPVVDDWF